jgi:hypothetical protein
VAGDKNEIAENNFCLAVRGLLSVSDFAQLPGELPNNGSSNGPPRVSQAMGIWER